MESRKIQRSGTTYYVYLPAAWCRRHNITTDSVVYLERSSKGDLIVQPKKTESSLAELKLELSDSSPEVINKMLIAAYINPVKEFTIELEQPLSPDQILDHKQLLGGLELVDFEEKAITCQTSLSLTDPHVLLLALIRKILSITKLMKKDKGHELIQRYEEEVDKSNLLINKAIITTLMYRKETDLRHIELYYIGHISRNLEQLTDIIINLDDEELIDIIHMMMGRLQDIVEKIKMQKIVDYIKELEKLERVNVNDLASYKRKRAYQHLGHIGEILSDWIITDKVDK